MKIPSHFFSAGLTATVIWPATQKHVDKYLPKTQYMVAETPQLYKEVTEPYITSQQFSLQVRCHLKTGPCRALIQVAKFYIRVFSLTWGPIYTDFVVQHGKITRNLWGEKEKKKK